ncbi:flagellar export chaperone FliS [Verrucomicrobia bacterium]|jgi:flagellar protein FliS|nr:flagellar export chaperone FliS [Verrucomicrobiota bacterium]
MNSASKLNAYRVAAVNTSSAENLVVMLYDGAIRFLGIAIKAFDREDPLDFNFTVHENITRTQAIIRELNRSLDPEKAGELGDHLVSLYDYFDSRLQEANVQKNKKIIEEIRTRLTELRDAWNESLNQLNEAPDLAATPAPAPVPTAAPAPVAQPLPVAAPASSPGEYTGLSLMG